MATLKTIQAALDAIEAGSGNRGTTGAALQDIIYSLSGVGGTMQLSAPGTSFSGDASWKRFDLWESSVDTKGVQDGLTEGGGPEGWYKIKPNGDGDYICNFKLRFSTDTTGDYRMRLRHVLADASEQSFLTIDRKTVVSGIEDVMSVSNNTKLGFAEGDKIQVELYAPSGAVVTPLYGTFNVMRM